MHNKTEQKLPRVGHVNRPDREWEIWNDNYLRETGKRFHRLAVPWVAWHPKHGSFDLPTHEAAIQVATSFH